VDHRGRFGLLASLPLPDVDAAVAEIAYCCEHLEVDGFALLTNVGGTYLGDRSRAPVFRELNRRQARVFIHPTSPACWQHTSLGRPRPMLEHLHFGTDYPFTPEFAAAMAVERLAAAGEAPGSLTEALRTNTKRLFPALGAAARCCHAHSHPLGG
jgi:predicted TIM-barrel fold metal-dependent hydrolase